MAVRITAGISALAGAFLGFRLSTRTVLIIESLILGFIMLIVSLGAVAIAQNWILAAGAGLCVCCSGLAFCILVSKRLLWKRLNPTRLFWLLLVSALTVTVLLGGATERVTVFSCSPSDLLKSFLAITPFWASVVLGGRLRKDLLASAVIPSELPVEAAPETPVD